MSLSDNEPFYSEDDQEDLDESEHFQAQDEYEEIDGVCELVSALKEYAKLNSLYLCEKLDADKMYQFFNKNT